MTQYDEIEYDEYELSELRRELQHTRKVIKLNNACQCSDDVPYSCVGVLNCPYADIGEDDEDS